MKEMIAKRISRVLIALLAVIAVSCFVMQDGMQAHADETRTFPIWFGSVQVTEENAEDVLNDGGTVKFMAGSNTLVLDNANLIAQVPGEEYKEYDSPVAIYAEDINLTVDFKGENRIFASPGLHSYGIVKRNSRNKGKLDQNKKFINLPLDNKRYVIWNIYL